MSQTKLTVEQLTAIEALITKGWTQGYNALNALGNIVAPTDADAARFCLVGACSAVLRNRNYPWLSCMLTQAARNYIGDIQFIEEWNDTLGRTQADVLSLIAQVKADRMKEEGTKS